MGPLARLASLRAPPDCRVWAPSSSSHGHLLQAARRMTRGSSRDGGGGGGGGARTPPPTRAHAPPRAAWPAPPRCHRRHGAAATDGLCTPRLATLPVGAEAAAAGGGGGGAHRVYSVAAAAAAARPPRRRQWRRRTRRTAAEASPPGGGGGAGAVLRELGTVVELSAQVSHRGISPMRRLDPTPFLTPPRRRWGIRYAFVCTFQGIMMRRARHLLATAPQ
jgi:hypothetical protein